MRRSVVIVVIGLWVGVVAYGAVGSAAWFTDQEVVPVSAAAATLDIQVADLTNGGVADSEAGTVAVGHQMSGMLPGLLAPELLVEVTNIGETPGWLRLGVAKTGGSNNIYNNMTVWAAYPDDCDSPSVFSQIYGGPLNGLSTAVPTWMDGSVYFDPGESMCIQYEFMLAETATDMGGVAEFELVFTMGQTNDPAFIP